MNLKILFVEDNPQDVELILHEIEKNSIEVHSHIVSDMGDIEKAVQDQNFDMVVCDYRLPGFTGLDVLKYISSLEQDLPVLLVSGTVPDEKAIDAVLAGAKDYILKDNLTRLVPAIRREYDALLQRRERKSTEERYRFLFDNSPNPMMVLRNSDHKIVGINKAACSMYGYSREEMLEKTAYDIRPEEDAAHFKKLVGQQTQNDQDTRHHSKVRHMTKEGNIILVDIFSRPAVIDGENVDVVVINDMTEKYANQEQLVSSNNLLSTLVESAPVAVVTLDRNGCVDEVWNKKAEELFGWKREEVIGKLIPNVPKSKEKEFQENLELALSGRIEPVVELDRLTKSGDILHIRERVTLIPDNSGEVDKVMLLIEDITDQRQTEQALVESEEKYRNLVEASHDLIWRVDREGKFNFINKASEDILGYPPEDLIGALMINYIHEDDKERIAEIHEEVINGQTFDSFDLTMVNVNGNLSMLAAKAYPTRDNQGKIIGCSGTATDITHIRAYQEQLEKNLMEKEILIKEIHHRVKNNLAVISGIIGLQVMHIEDEMSKTVFEQSQSRIKSIALIHERLYQTELFSSIEIKEYLEELIKDIRSTYGTAERNIDINVTGSSISMNINQAVPFGILANELITNALKYAFEGRNKGSITVNLDQDQKNKDSVVFEVFDNGIGLPYNFEEMKIKSLGMTLVETVSEQLSGELSWDHRKDKGTKFSVRFQLSEMNTWAQKISPEVKN